MPRSPAKSLTSTAASPPDTSLDPPRDAEEVRPAGSQDRAARLSTVFWRSDRPSVALAARCTRHGGAEAARHRRHCGASHRQHCGAGRRRRDVPSRFDRLR
jgi:hypothetical protein